MSYELEGDSLALAERHAVEHAESINVPQQKMGIDVFTVKVATRIQEPEVSETTPIRTFSTGATRNIDTNKLDFEGFYHPSVMKAFAEYMHKNRIQADGNLRASDNWQKGIPRDAYMKSLWRHFFESWELHRGGNESALTPTGEAMLIEALCAQLFNVQGYLFELLKARQEVKYPQSRYTPDFPYYDY